VRIVVQWHGQFGLLPLGKEVSLLNSNVDHAALSKRRDNMINPDSINLERETYVVEEGTVLVVSGSSGKSKRQRKPLSEISRSGRAGNLKGNRIMECTNLNCSNSVSKDAPFPYCDPCRRSMSFEAKRDLGMIPKED